MVAAAATRFHPTTEHTYNGVRHTQHTLSNGRKVTAISVELNVELDTKLSMPAFGRIRFLETTRGNARSTTLRVAEGGPKEMTLYSIVPSSTGTIVFLLDTADALGAYREVIALARAGLLMHIVHALDGIVDDESALCQGLVGLGLS